MQSHQEAALCAQIIFDGHGRIYTHDGRIVMDGEGVKFASGEIFQVTRADFDLIEELGTGQYGTVWAVRHRPTDTKMALKAIKLSITESAIKQIMTELDILVRAKSLFIVECYGAFCSEGAVYFCMELMDGGSLEKQLPTSQGMQKGHIGESVYKAIAYSVIQGLGFLRDKFSVIHRDIKPSNILLGLDGRVKICDFGVAGYLVRSLARTRVGTSNYMAPERITLGIDELGGGGYGAKSDVWSIGATLMEMATGQPPFPLSKYDCIFAQLMDIIHSEPPKLPADQFSADFVDFVDRCLAKDPKQRPNYAELLEHPFLVGMTRERAQAIMHVWMSENKRD